MKKIIASIVLVLFAFSLIAPAVEAKTKKSHYTSRKHVSSYVRKGKIVKGHTKTVHKGHRR